MKNHRIVFMICAILLIGLSCDLASATGKSWEQEWERVKLEARKEGKVVLAGNIGPAAAVFKKILPEKFGITPEIVTSRGSETATKMVQEQNAGLYLTDVLFSTTTSVITVLKPNGRLDRIDSALVLPEVKDPKAWYRGEIPYVDKEKKYHIAFFAVPKSGALINTQLVAPGDLKSYYDLLQPRWKGKILVNDPTLSGAGNSWFTPLAEQIGLDYIKKLLLQEPVVSSDQRLATEWLARGKYPIYLGCDEQTIAEFVKAGAPVDTILLKEGAYLTQSNGAVSLVTKAPHPNASKVVINWALSREGGRMLSEAVMNQSARVDVPADFLPAAYRRQQ